jgi:hypothetical protein
MSVLRNLNVSGHMLYNILCLLRIPFQPIWLHLSVYLSKHLRLSIVDYICVRLPTFASLYTHAYIYLCTEAYMPIIRSLSTYLR